ncbi:MAG: 30S ribosomal protein S16 [Dissulfurimicrobium sp.]|uniref:30S ribosomal protein S16 n=1 Tax=Dissulfurimicrobium sp. TaxID=2022436 RepID=UPI00404B01C2
MAVKIRLTRMGRKKRPFYRVVAAEVGAKRDGRFLEILGTYDPLKNPYELKINTQRLEYWLAQGAQPSDTMSSLLKNQKA